jgi:hypothetical protein
MCVNSAVILNVKSASAELHLLFHGCHPWAGVVQVIKTENFGSATGSVPSARNVVFLGAFAKLQKATIMSVRPSV